MEPTLQDIPLICKCGHRWMDKLMVGVGCRRFSRYMKTLQCPECGAGYRKIAFSNEKPLPLPDERTTQ